MLFYCNRKIKEINSFFITEEQICLTRNALTKQFDGTVAVSGTSFHQLDKVICKEMVQIPDTHSAT